MAAGLRFRPAYFSILGILTAANLVLSAIERGRKETSFSLDLDRLPLTISGWEGEDFIISEREKKILGTPNLLFRRYRKDNRTVNLYILESATNRASFHPPEYCYIGGRTEMVERSRVTLPGPEHLIPTRRFVFVGPRGQSLVYYWYTYGDLITDNYYRQQMYVVSRIFFGDPKPAMLIRLSVDGQSSLEDGDETIREFIRDVLPAFQDYLLGRAATG